MTYQKIIFWLYRPVLVTCPFPERLKCTCFAFYFPAWLLCILGNSWPERKCSFSRQHSTNNMTATVIRFTAKKKKKSDRVSVELKSWVRAAKYLTTFSKNKSDTTVTVETCWLSACWFIKPIYRLVSKHRKCNSCIKVWWNLQIIS